jgi:hypothetical protein
LITLELGNPYWSMSAKELLDLILYPRLRSIKDLESKDVRIRWSKGDYLDVTGINIIKEQVFILSSPYYKSMNAFQVASRLQCLFRRTSNKNRSLIVSKDFQEREVRSVFIDKYRVTINVY